MGLVNRALVVRSLISSVVPRKYSFHLRASRFVRSVQFCLLPSVYGSGCAMLFIAIASHAAHSLGGHLAGRGCGSQRLETNLSPRFLLAPLAPIPRLARHQVRASLVLVADARDLGDLTSQLQRR